MSLEQWTAFFGWSTLVHTILLCFATLMLALFRDLTAGLHARIFGLDPIALPVIYFWYLAIWKIGIILFALVPWLVLVRM